MELENVRTRKPQKKRRPITVLLGDSAAKSLSWARPSILTKQVRIISAGLRVVLGLVLPALVLGQRAGSRHRVGLELTSS